MYTASPKVRSVGPKKKERLEESSEPHFGTSRQCSSKLLKCLFRNNVVTFLTDRGTCFEDTFVVPFGRLNDPATWLNVNAMNSLKLYLTNGDAGAKVDVALQQFRTY